MKNFLQHLKYVFALLGLITMFNSVQAQAPALELLPINPNGNAVSTNGSNVFGGESQKISNGKYVFFANNGTNGKQLYLTDGTLAGTQQLIAPSDYSNGYTDYASIKVYGDDIYIQDVDASYSNANLVYYNGASVSSSGTVITPNSTNTDGFVMLGKAGSYVYFADGTDLRRTDGTAGGTILMASNIFLGGVGKVISAVSGNTLYFKKTGTGATNFELWKSEGTIESTVLVKRFDAPSSNSYDGGIIVATDNGTVFVYPKNITTATADAEWWRLDAGILVKITNYGNFNVKLANPSIRVVGNTLYVAAATGTTSTATRQVWKLDANTANAISPLFDGSSNAQISSISFKKYTNGKLHFIVVDNGYYRDYATDGSTVEQFLYSGSANTWTTFKGKEYAIQYDEVEEWALFESDGTLGGTRKLFKPVGDTFLNAFGGMGVTDNKLVFVEGGGGTDYPFKLHSYDGNEIKAITGTGADELAAGGTDSFNLITSGNAVYIFDQTNKTLYYTDGNAVHGVSINDVSISSLRGVFAVSNNKIFAWLTYKTDPFSNSSYTDFFELKGELTLPVQLTNFTAKADGNRSKLEWATAQELNNKEFLIYRKGESGDFVQVGTKAGAGTVATPQNYVWYDNSPLNGTNYYKLVQVDFDGTSKELGVKAVDFSLSTKEGLKVYPNPVTNGIVSASFPIAAGGATLSLLNIQGKTVATEAVAPGLIRTSINVSRLAAGTYVLVYSSGTEMLTAKVIIQ